jgi:hypothetical protein
MTDAGNDEVEALKAEVARLKAAQNAPPPLQPIQGGGGAGPIGLIVAIMLIGAVVAAGYYFASPLVALEALRSAAKSGDRDKLDRLVDFPVLRANLKSELSAKMLKAMQDDPSMRDNPWAGLGAVFAPAVVDRLVDAYVTPDTISTMVETGKAPPPGSSPSPAPATPDSASNLKTEMGYADLGHFRTKLIDTSDPKNQLTLTMERRNLFGWKLVRLDFDVDTASQADSSASAAADDAQSAAAEAVSAAPSAAPAAASAEGSQSLAATAPPRRLVRRGAAPGSDAYVCAHGDHSNADVIEACDRAQIAANRGEE